MKSFHCSTCQKKYLSKTALNRHIKYDCGKEPMFRCYQCTYRAHQKVHLQKHLLKMHRRVNFENPHTCERCHKRYKNYKDLKKHLKECGTPPAFSCDFCSYKSHRKFNVKKHMQYTCKNAKNK
ncbi:hypothetical protein RI129_008161 [Pyrocoelia pectoralis]|uniref:C2H2-type domain-containing protein n=1 Tax=Pyrocoelia pectoralis TaxID=417401 RepID=A0AAN7V9D3_9COLE